MNNEHDLEIIFNDNKVHEILQDKTFIYKNSKLYYLLISVNSKVEYPHLTFCKTITVTLLNLSFKLNLKE